MMEIVLYYHSQYIYIDFGIEYGGEKKTLKSSKVATLEEKKRKKLSFYVNVYACVIIEDHTSFKC